FERAAARAQHPSAATERGTSRPAAGPIVAARCNPRRCFLVSSPLRAGTSRAPAPGRRRSSTDPAFHQRRWEPRPCCLRARRLNLGGWSLELLWMLDVGV